MASKIAKLPSILRTIGKNMSNMPAGWSMRTSGEQEQGQRRLDNHGFWSLLSITGSLSLGGVTNFSLRCYTEYQLSGIRFFANSRFLAKKVHCTPSKLSRAREGCLPIRRFEIGLRWIRFDTLSKKTIVIDGHISSGKTCLEVVKLDRLHMFLGEDY